MAEIVAALLTVLVFFALSLAGIIGAVGWTRAQLAARRASVPAPKPYVRPQRSPTVTE